MTRHPFSSVLFAAAFTALLPSARAAEEISPRVRTCFDAGWQFHRGDAPGADQPGFDASGWRPLDLPHDWAVESPFDPKAASGAPGGYLPGGVGWYRKSFRSPAGPDARRITIEFDGVYMNSEVWINGHHLGKRPYGYLGFAYDLTPHLIPDAENIIAVRVDNSRLPSARWYTGSGIYRHVWLNITHPLHVAHWGTRITTPEISETSAAVAIETSIRNHHSSAKQTTIRQTIIDADAKPVATTETAASIAAGAQLPIAQTLSLENPKRWSPDQPYLYTVRTELIESGKTVDRYHTPLGIREIRFDAANGLFVNGVNTKMKGVCNHQDLGPLGSALWDQALERRMRMLKDMGCNAIRTSHYPHSPELMALCDKLGFLVVNETFDEWRRGWNFEGSTLVSSKDNKGKAPFGYNKYFDDWHERDLTDHIRRDRNHPSVIMWSVGNEVPESMKNGENETIKRLVEICRKTDPTRPVTVGCNHIKSANATGFTELLDIVGYNEGVDSLFEVEGDRTRYPGRMMYFSEIPHSLQTRGEYRTHPRYHRPGFDHPKLTEHELFPETDGHYESSYDNSGVQIDARGSWRMTKNLPYVMGEFRWTGFDYIGESGGWPRVLGNFGIIDLCNFPKDTYYFYQSQWTEKPMAHLLPHWTWPGKEGSTIPVWCYTNCDEAELFLNGKSLGTRKFDEKNDMHLEWLVPYQPGELKVIARNNGDVAASSKVHTAGAPARFALEADQSTLDPSRRDLSFVTIRVEDQNGHFQPCAETWVTIQIDGPARIVGSGNGDPLSHTSYQANTLRTFNGLARVIVAATTGADDQIPETSTRKPNEIILKASSRNFPSTEIQLTRTHETASTTTTGSPTPLAPAATDEVDGLPAAK